MKLLITNYPLFLQKIVLGRILAIDYGKKRTGIAVTDELRLIASGLTTIQTADIIPFLKEYLSKELVDVIVVGEPKQMNNTPSESEVLIVPFIQEITKHFPKLPIERQDERFTSKMAFQTMLDGGLKKGQRRNKALIDEISATIILQSYMESNKF